MAEGLNGHDRKATCERKDPSSLQTEERQNDYVQQKVRTLAELSRKI